MARLTASTKRKKRILKTKKGSLNIFLIIIFIISLGLMLFAINQRRIYKSSASERSDQCYTVDCSVYSGASKVRCNNQTCCRAIRISYYPAPRFECVNRYTYLKKLEICIFGARLRVCEPGLVCRSQGSVYRCLEEPTITPESCDTWGTSCDHLWTQSNCCRGLWCLTGPNGRQECRVKPTSTPIPQVPL